MAKTSLFADKYAYRVVWSDEDEAYVATCTELPSLSAVEATQDKALKEIVKVVRSALEWMEEEGEVIPEPFALRKYSGKLILRIPPDLHRLVSMRSAEAHTSINQWLIKKICS